MTRRGLLIMMLTITVTVVGGRAAVAKGPASCMKALKAADQMTELTVQTNLDIITFFRRMEATAGQGAFVFLNEFAAGGEVLTANVRNRSTQQFAASKQYNKWARRCRQGR